MAMERFRFVCKTRLSPSLLKSFHVCRTFHDKTARVNGLDWDKAGETLLASSDDETVHVYRLDKGDLHKTLHSKRYGVDQAKFVYRSNRTCIAASKAASNQPQRPFALRLWDLAENRYTSYIPLEAAPCRGVGLSLHPYRLLVLASCNDGIIRLFCLDSDKPLGKFQGHTTNPVAAFDAEGLVFVTYQGLKKLHLYDCQNFGRGEFAVFDIEHLMRHPEEEPLSLVFSPDGQHIVFSTNFNRLLKVNAFDGEEAVEFIPDGSALQVDEPTGWKDNCFPIFTPDGQFLLCGATDCKTHVWSATGGKEIAAFGGHAGPPRFVQFNPNKALLASACLDVVIWQPGAELAQKESVDLNF